MAQYIYTMNKVSKIVPPKREILKDISLSFFPGAKIGVLGLNGAGKSTLLRIMAGVDTEFNGEARAQPGIKIGYLAQEPQLDPAKDVRGNVEDGVREALDALARLDQIYAEYAEPDECVYSDKLGKDLLKENAVYSEYYSDWLLKEDCEEINEDWVLVDDLEEYRVEMGLIEEEVE